MLNGTYSSGQRVVEYSKCRSSTKYQFRRPGDYKIHATSLMSEIPFGEPTIIPESIDATIFLNDRDTKLTFSTSVKCQNFLTTHFYGKYPLENYSDGHYTPAGTVFELTCTQGNPNKKYRSFGNESINNGYGRSIPQD